MFLCAFNFAWIAPSPERMQKYLFFCGERSEGHRQLHHHVDSGRRVGNDTHDFGVDGLVFTKYVRKCTLKNWKRSTAAVQRQLRTGLKYARYVRQRLFSYFMPFIWRHITNPFSIAKLAALSSITKLSSADFRQICQKASISVVVSTYY